MPVASSAATFAALGVNVRQGLANPEQAFEQTVDGLARIRDAGTAAAKAAELLGKDAGPSIAALKRLVGTTLAADLKDGGAEAARFGAALKRTIVAVDGMADVAVRQAGRSARFLGD